MLYAKLLSYNQLITRQLIELQASCQNVNHIMNRFFIFFLYRISYHIVYCKIHKHLIKFIKNYRYTYIKGISIINFKYVPLMTNLFITYVIISNKLTK